MAVRQASEQHDAMIVTLASQNGDLMVELTRERWSLSRDRMKRFGRQARRQWM